MYSFKAYLGMFSSLCNCKILKIIAREKCTCQILLTIATLEMPCQSRLDSAVLQRSLFGNKLKEPGKPNINISKIPYISQER